MTTTPEIQKAVVLLFSANHSKKAFSTDFICRYVEQYLQLTEPIKLGDMITVLRDLPNCVARPKMRQPKDQPPEILWNFVSPPEPLKRVNKSTRKVVSNKDLKKKTLKNETNLSTTLLKNLKMHRSG
jgi:hypothetical protein